MASTMAGRATVLDELVLLLAGFVLTTVVGGFLGFWFQGRAWRQQERVRLAESEREAARAVFEDLSRIFDRRLHRMRQLDHRLAQSYEAGEVERAVARYRDAVDEWNDNLNRILALTQRYFGPAVRDYLDNQLMSRVVRTGGRLEARVREYQTGGKASSPSLESELQALRAEVYILNVQLIEAVQLVKVGVFLSETHAESRAGNVRDN